MGTGVCGEEAPMSRFTIAFCFALVVAGCEKERVRIVVEPRPDGTFVRTIHLWKADKDKILPPDEERVDRTWEFYEERLEPLGKIVRFRGIFRKPPPDVVHEGRSNVGGYDVWQAGPGWLGIYRERRPGATDLFAKLQKVAEGIDLLSRILAETMREQLAGEPGLDALVAFLSGPFREDLKEMVFHFAGGSYDLATADDRLLTAFSMVLQFAEERGYLAVADLPRALNLESLRELVSRFVARKMERSLDDDLREKLAFLTDAGKLTASMERAMKKLGEPGEDFGKAMEPFLKDVIRFDLFSSDEILDLVLELPPGAELLHTSGTRNLEKRRIEWTDTIDARAVRSLYHASFAVADEEWQTKHLGRVALPAKDLPDYVLWVNGLPEAQAGAWREAVNALTPGDDLIERLRAIRVTPREEGDEEVEEKGAKILIKALKAD
jgi:hypothetical protein